MTSKKRECLLHCIYLSAIVCECHALFTPYLPCPSFATPHTVPHSPIAMQMGATAEARAYVESQGEGWRTLLEQAISTSIKERAPDMAGRIGELLLEGPGGAALGGKKVSFENLHLECDSLQAPPSAARAPSLGDKAGRRFTVANMDPKIIAAKCVADHAHMCMCM